MARHTIVFVHGTGVRLGSYLSGFATATACAAAAGITARFIECAWGDPLGVEFTGESLPDPPSAARLQADQEDFARWQWLIDDPLFELDKLAIRDISAAKARGNPRLEPEWSRLWNEIAAYTPSLELRLLLDRGALAPLWDDAWARIIRAPIARGAFEASALELAEASHALARAVVAQLYVEAANAGLPGPYRSLRTSLYERLTRDWNQLVYGRSAFLWNFFSRAATRVLRRHRDSFSGAAALPVGDILLYQAHGAKVRDFIRQKIEAADPPVTIVAHSLGGIACVDLMAMPNPPPVARLVTAGSQAPLLYEIGALSSLTRPARLPKGFPPWLNLYDPNDFLSYVARRLFPGVEDLEVESGLSFPDSHSAYFSNDEVWQAIGRFMATT